MADMSYGLYDTALFGSTANTEHILFQVTQGSTTAATESATNMRGAGSLPQQEQMVVNKVGVFADYNSVTADYQNLWVSSFLEMRVSETRMLWLPLAACAQYNAFQGLYTQGTAANEALIGRIGEGYMLDIPIVLEGGTNFRVRVFQGTALSTTNLGVKVVLHGTLTIP